MILKLGVLIILIYRAHVSYTFECICNDNIEAYNILAKPHPKLHNHLPSDYVGVAYLGDCFLYNGTEVYDNKTFWKTDINGKVGWFWILDYQEPHIQNCSNPVRDIEEGANCVLVMTAIEVYNQPYESLEYGYMSIYSCRGSACPKLNSDEAIQMNNHSWYNVTYHDLVNGYVLADKTIRWYCSQSEDVKGTVTHALPVWGIILIIIAGVSALAISGFILHRMRQSKLKMSMNEETFEGIQSSLDYDVFVSYSRDDWEWVTKVLFQKLRDEGYSVCIDFKDFVPGMDVSENIMNAIYRSKKTIVVISKNFLKSMWGRFELQQAHYKAIAQRKDTLILIKFHKCQVPRRLMGKTFLDWTSKKEKSFFWKRLLQSVGTQSNISSNLSLATETNKRG